MPETASHQHHAVHADTAEAGAPHGLHIDPGWKALKGVAYGLKQATLLGKVTVSVPPGFSVTAFDEILAPFFDVPSAAPERTMIAEECLLRRLLSWQAAVQRQQKIPVLGSFLANPLPKTGLPGREFAVAIPYHSPAASIEACGRIAGIMNLAIHEADAPAMFRPRARTEFDLLMHGLRRFALAGINNFHLVEAARRLDIPVRGVLQDTFCLGLGAQARWLQSTITDRTAAMGVDIARSKSRTASMLREHGVPVPLHGSSRDEEDAVRMAHKFGFPVVIKPDDQEQGRGVTAGLQDEASLRLAYRRAGEYSKNILVEKHHPGQDYRLTVYQGEVVKILNRRAGGVLGDGVHSVSELVRIEQETVRLRNVYRQTGKHLLELDSEALALLTQQGLGPDDVPAAGAFVVLRSKSNISAGGIQTLIPVESAHPDNVQLAVRATAAMHLDLCGVDLLINDIAASWLDTGAVIIEMNAKPQIGISLAPEIYQSLVKGLVQGDGRIPVELVVCATEADCPSEQEALASVKASRCNGLSTPHGVWIDGRRLVAPQHDGFAAARILLLSDAVHGALCVMTARDIVQNGLPADRFARVTVRDQAHATPGEKSALQGALAMLGAKPTVALTA